MLASFKMNCCIFSSEEESIVKPMIRLMYCTQCMSLFFLFRNKKTATTISSKESRRKIFVFYGLSLFLRPYASLL